MYINKYMYSVGTQSGSLKIYVLYTVHVLHYCMYNKYNTIQYFIYQEETRWNVCVKIKYLQKKKKKKNYYYYKASVYVLTMYK